MTRRQHRARKPQAVTRRKWMGKKRMTLVLASTLAAAVAIGLNKKQLLTLVQNAFKHKPNMKQGPKASKTHTTSKPGSKAEKSDEKGATQVVWEKGTRVLYTASDGKTEPATIVKVLDLLVPIRYYLSLDRCPGNHRVVSMDNLSLLPKNYNATRGEEICSNKTFNTSSSLNKNRACNNLNRKLRKENIEGYCIPSDDDNNCTYVPEK